MRRKDYLKSLADIVSGEKTILNYLLQPVTKVANELSENVEFR